MNPIKIIISYIKQIKTFKDLPHTIFIMDEIKVIADILLSKGINIFENKNKKTDDPTYQKNYYLHNKEKFKRLTDKNI